MSNRTVELIPELIRFYGGCLEDWLKLSMRDTLFFVEAIPKIKAREKLEQIEVLAMGNGLMKPIDQERIRHEWYRQAGLIIDSRAKLSKAQQEVMLGAMGVKIEWQKKN